MDNMKNTAKNMALGALVGATALAAGAMYVSENKNAKKMVNKAKRTGEKMIKAGGEYIHDIID